MDFEGKLIDAYFGLLGVLAVTLIISKRLGRKHKWYLAVWAPSVLLPLYVLGKYLLPIPGNLGSGPDAGFVGMEIGFYLMFIGPFLVPLALYLIVLLVRFPTGDAWNRYGALS